jgi:hypothetical protein
MRLSKSPWAAPGIGGVRSSPGREAAGAEAAAEPRKARFFREAKKGALIFFTSLLGGAVLYYGPLIYHRRKTVWLYLLLAPGGFSDRVW